MSSDDRSSTDRIRVLAEQARELADTAIGMGVLCVQKLQVCRVELEKFLGLQRPEEGGRRPATQSAIDQARRVDGAIAVALRKVDATLDPMTQRLPGPARNITSSARSSVGGLHARVSQMLASVDGEDEASGTDDAGAETTPPEEV
jgi:hypothetical protein